MSCPLLRWRGCTFKNLDNAQSNPWTERKVEKGKESENRRKGERLGRGREEEGEREREGESVIGAPVPPEVKKHRQKH